MPLKEKYKIPADGILGLKENFKTDAISGFIVFLLALPLSLGIAKASEFQPIMGVLTAIIGGLIVSLFMGSRLTIKGPAAGLIVIVAGAVAEFGQGDQVLGWKLALGTMAVAGIVQIIFGLLKLGKLADFFPLSAIHGMLAAIGIVIIAKQIPVLLNVNPILAKGKEPIELLASIPNYIINLNLKATFIGIVSLSVMLGWPYLKSKTIKMIPAPLVVLLFAIPCQLLMNFRETEPEYSLVKIGSLIDSLHFNVSFDGFSQTELFLKYVLMFALVGSIESLLTVKAIDLMDPYKRKSNMNQDLIAIGIGNTIAALFGGLPMISEVARSSSNINNGAKTRWANFFHGFFILIFVLLATPILELIPNSALAAMLIMVGIKLTHPREFINTFKIGIEQLAIFLTTIFFTLLVDLLIGVASGIVLKTIIHLYHGAPFKSLFKATAAVSSYNNNYLIEVEESAIFSNFLGIKSRIEAIPAAMNVTIDFAKTKLVDHDVMKNIQLFKHNYTAKGGKVTIIGLENHTSLSDHKLASRKIG
jgi:MFS superfamily sulfate permease-like transporter